MKEISFSKVVETIKKMFMNCAVCVDSKVLIKLKEVSKKEVYPTAKEILNQIIENDEYAVKKNIPMCQDTGIAVVFVEIGSEVYCPFSLENAINEGVRQAYCEGYLRKSVVHHPLERINTRDNTPAIIHYKHVVGDTLTFKTASKGAGSENMSHLTMLNPTDGTEGIIDFVLDCIKKASGKPCPPLIVGIGIGGNFEKCALLAKEALLRDFDDESSDPICNNLEKLLLNKINQLNIGPMGLGGDTTALAVKINSYPCHIASLPVAVNIQCHASRHEEVSL